ncbi:MAG: hypothetical protein COU29_01705 [Candidatus Magasanikbacteria bacterium CG10_big_fil_rev_8_21_14_0_10_36_32]|uniref:Uncharacterized protein n=1 Tax=Candidatus Magasanikbacteria bacterium CG10_big_fil_rev_8_21_14_0_10_36_32 TaxID=1974646 RepID=A0A2M6W6Q7_9BACT|nr:MAG: hypothetical protein COU29_01705 [Candidatus Magasanikbacteria bacterium CG10_big_fil_rev_8_21_14_0_10_36_32]
MKKIIQSLVIIILLAIVSLIIIVFNPMNLRVKLIGGIINSYLSQNITENSSVVDVNVEKTNVSNDKNPLLNAEQEKTLENLGVNVDLLPTEITPAMQECFLDKLGKERTDELIKGATPGAMDIIQGRECLVK